MPIKFLVLRGILFFLGGGRADFIVVGARIFLRLSGLFRRSASLRILHRTNFAAILSFS